MLKLYNLKYYPSFKSEDSMVVAIIVYDIFSKKIYLKRKHDIDKVKKLDKEINIDFFISNVLGIKKEVEKLCICELNDYVKKYVNEYQFEKIS